MFVEKEIMDADGILLCNGLKVNCLRLAKLILKKELIIMGYKFHSNGSGKNSCHIVYDNFGSFILKPYNVVILTLGRLKTNDIVILYWEDKVFNRTGNIFSNY
jgi:hypothetical protein